MSRPSFDSTWIAIANTIAARSSCSRLHVGSILVSTDNRTILSVGYNGSPKGLHNGCERPNEKGNCGCIHAETNLAINLDKKAECKLYITHVPCANCAKTIINLGIVKEVIYLNDYSYQEAFDLFSKSGIKIRKYEAEIP